VAREETSALRMAWADDAATKNHHGDQEDEWEDSDEGSSDECLNDYSCSSQRRRWLRFIHSSRVRSIYLSS